MTKLTDYKNIHCVGIGGVGLSAIAEIFLDSSYNVSGSDLKENPTTQRLEKLGATIYIGHSETNVFNSDLVIYSSAVTEDNPELVAAKNMNIPLLSRAQVLGILMKEYKESIAVSGTHGKTTTTSMISLILKDALLEPTILIGGILPAIGGNVQIGQKEYIVAEACEYMDSFLSLYPTRKVILNIDSDHLDYFKDINHIVSSFEKFINLEPENGTVIAYTANPFVNSIINRYKGRVITFGLNPKRDYWVENIVFNSQGLPSFDVIFHGEILGNLQLTIPGEHNIINALAAFACCHDIGVPPGSIIKTLEVFQGTQRRFDILGTTDNGVKIIDDYAHHPTEIKVTLDACKNFDHKKLWCIFQPHTYTRTLALFNEFAEAFDDADAVILAKIFPAREKDIYNVDSNKLAAEIKKTSPSKEVYSFESFPEIVDFIKTNAKEGDLVITMGAGDIYKVAEILASPSGPIV